MCIYRALGFGNKRYPQNFFFPEIYLDSSVSCLSAFMKSIVTNLTLEYALFSWVF